MDTGQGNNGVTGPPTEAQPAPSRKRGKYRQRTLDLPEGMTEQILAWSCGVKENVIYRWKTGVPMSETGRLVVALWNHLGKERFIEMVKEIRHTDPPTEHEERKNLPDLIIKILEGAEGPVTSQFIEEILEIEFGKYTTKDSLRTMLWNMKKHGRVFSPARNQWTLSAPGNRSGPSENQEEKHGQDHQCSAPRN